MNTNRRRLSRRVAVLLPIVAIDAAGLGMMFPVLPDLLRRLTGRGSADVSLMYGVVVASYALAQFVTAPVLGGLSDRFGRRPVLLVSIDAYMCGLEDRLTAGKPLGSLHSVASFFVSRVDVEVDRRLQDLEGSGSVEQHKPHRLAGKTGIANAKLAYRLFRDEFSSSRWKRLARQGANVQRPLWASTGVKNPAYRDVMYVEALIGTDMVVTMPPSTMDAFRDHGVVGSTITTNIGAAEEVISGVEQAGIELRDVTAKLLADGIASFQRSSIALLKRLTQKAADLDVELVDGS
jgi:hypothetical protein